MLLSLTLSARQLSLDTPRNVQESFLRQRCRSYAPVPGVENMSSAMRVAGLLLLLSGVAPAWSQAPIDKQDTKPTPPRWTILFRADDPSVWDTDAKGAKGEQIAIPLRFAPATFRYLRLRRMDTG